MKQVININFHGQVVPIEVSAFDLLKNYTDSLARFFANEEGKDEIINDIESRIGELFQERLKKGATCITDDDVNAIIKSMGRPEEFDGEEEKVASSLGAGDNTSSSTSGSQQTATHKRLYRDENNKVIGGVCSGIANYFNTDPIIIRIIFVLLAFAGAGVLAYFILWAAVPSTASKEIGGVRKKLFRDPDDKIIGGVGSGLGNYFGVSPWIPRVLFLIPFLSIAFRWHEWGFFDFPSFLSFSFSPGSLIIYIILWLVLPEASSTTEKLEMKGEKVDMNSIKNSVMEEMKGVQQRAEKFAKEASSVAGEKGQQLGAEIKSVAKKGGRSLGDVIVLLVKAFAYFVIGCVVFALVVALFGLAIGALNIFPYKDYFLNDGWQNVFAWGTLLFFITVPVIGIITWIIRKIAKIKSGSKVLRASFVSLWIVGWICVTFLFASVSRDFKSTNKAAESEVTLTNPSVEKLIVTTNYPFKKRNNNDWINFDEDTAFIRNVGVAVEKSTNDSFRVTIRKFASGNRKSDADTTAQKIEFSVKQVDSLLVLDKEFYFSKKDKFRNQNVVVTIYVPVGKKIRLDESIDRFEHVHIFWNGGHLDIDTDENELDKDLDYVMKEDGFLYSAKSGKRYDDRYSEPEEDEPAATTDSTNTKGGYRYNSQPVQKLDSLQQKAEDDRKRREDSIQKSIEKSQQELEKIKGSKQTAALNKNKSTSLSTYQMPLFIHL